MHAPVATSTAPRTALRRAFRFRHVGEYGWRNAVSENVSESGLLFLTAEPLEVGDWVEINLSPAVRLGATELGGGYARVVRRVLARWPDLDAAVAVEFADELPAALRESGVA